MPKLRFKDSRRQEFPEWINQRIGEVSIKVISGGTPDTNNARYWNGNINWLTPKEINSKYVKSSLRKISELGYQKSSAKLLPKGTVILTTRASIGLCCIQNTDSSFTTNQGFQSILFNPEKVYSEYGYYFLITDETQRKMKQLASGSTFLELSPKNLKKLNIPVPSLPEQQKIADFLTAYDTMIDTQSQRVEAMKTRKKGLLQKIFSQEIRFKNEQGQVYPEWIVQKLEELVSMHARIGWQNLRTSEFLNSGDYYLVTGTDFVNGKIDFSTCHYIGKERFEQDKKIQLDNDNILITKDGTLGKVAYVDILPKPTTLNAGIFCLKSKKQNINMKYLFQYLRGPFMMQYCNRHSTGGTIKHLNQGVLITFPVPLPSLSEQQKIADFLTAVDHQIEVEEKRLETMKTIKKGLLQQMFI